MTEENKKDRSEMTIYEKIEDDKIKFSAVLPSHTKPDRFVKSALIAVTENYMLQKCTHESILKSIYQAAETGLDFTKIRGHAFMVPFKNNKTGKYEAQFIPGYRGLIDLARRSGVVTKISAHIVYSKEVFEVKYGTEQKIIHEPIIDGSDRGDKIGAYAVFHIRDAEPHFEFMPIADIMKIKAGSKAKKNGKNVGPWADNEDEMIRKCPIRKGFKYVPAAVDKEAIRFEKAIEADNMLHPDSLAGLLEAPDIPEDDVDDKKPPEPQSDESIFQQQAQDADSKPVNDSDDKDPELDLE